jgi:hypothetical protein
MGQDLKMDPVAIVTSMKGNFQINGKKVKEAKGLFPGDEIAGGYTIFS